ncbi:MAG: pyrimidine dimer DNA glycosylase/endonuclease V [Candidatus Krumholzibacteriia bacterium]
MRLWSLHPKYLDSRGLVALWREGLLAQAVLRGETRGYRHHPQLERFRCRPSPVGAIAEYLRGVHAESAIRGFRFDRRKIDRQRDPGKAPVTRGQINYEWRHLTAKVRERDPELADRLDSVARPRAHPLFRIVPGGIESWERTSGGTGGQGPP